MASAIMVNEPFFGIVMRKLRKARNLSQEGLAFNSDLDRTYISMLERGLRQPCLQTITRIARALGIKPSGLLQLVEDEQTTGSESPEQNSREV